jgi:hypothetical protein
MKRGTRWLTLGTLACVLGAVAGLKAADQKKEGTPVKIDGLVSVTPPDWKKEEPPEKYRRLRLMQFRLPRTEGDAEDAELVINFFGKGSGGGLEENVQRWKGMFIPPKGKKIDDVTKVDNLKVGDVAVTTVEVHGTYKGTSFERMKPRPDYRMIKVYFDSKNGPYFLSLVGPDKTVEKHKKDFVNWLKGFKAK